MGTEYNKLEKELLKFLDISNITFFINAYLALEYIIKTINLLGKIITIPFVFDSTCYCEKWDNTSFLWYRFLGFYIDIKRIEDLIIDKRIAILPVHVYGNSCDVDFFNS